MIENITEVTPFLRPFPDPSEVFCEPASQYAKHMHPLVSVDLSAIHPQWNGWIHFVSPLEPYEGCIGDATAPYHNAYLRANWIAFKREDGRYRLLGDFRYFLLENSPDDPEVKELYEGHRADLEAHYAEQQASYEAKKACFLQHGALYHTWAQAQADGTYAKKDQINLIDQLGGKTGNRNWVSTSDFPVKIHDEDSRPITPDGRCYEFIGYVAGYNYRQDGADAIVLFYDPQTDVALLTFDYT